MRFFFLALALSCPAWAAGPVEELKEADRKFDRDTAARGLDGWMDSFAEDAQLNTPRGLIKGKAALREHYTRMFAQKDFSIRWHPTFAEASKDGTLGYTFGEAAISWTTAEGKRESRPGHYVTIWRRGPGGEWKAVTDMGN